MGIVLEKREFGECVRIEEFLPGQEWGMLKLHVSSATDRKSNNVLIHLLPDEGRNIQFIISLLQRDVLTAAR